MKLLHLLVAVSCGGPGPAEVERTAPAPTTRSVPPVRGREDALALIAEGRAHLDARRPAEAEAVFQRAFDLDGGSFRTRLWVLRAWMDAGRTNDTLDAIDALRRAGHEGPEMDYLYGMAFARRAEGHLAAGVDDTAILLNFQDAAERLPRALAADPERFRDAFHPLARAQWETAELELAHETVGHAVAAAPRDPAPRMLAGRIEFSRFEAARKENDGLAPEGWEPRARELWEASLEAFRQAIELCGEPLEDEHRRTILAETGVQLGNALVWGGRSEAAARAYGLAMGWSPARVDFRAVRTWLAASEPAEGSDPFHTALAEGARAFERRFGVNDPEDAALRWWLGWSCFQRGELDLAETHLLEALREAPAFVGAWYYVALVRLSRDDHDGALAALRRGWERDALGLLAEARTDPATGVPALEALLGWCVEEQRFLDAALAGEIVAEVVSEEPRHWNNLGYFLRSYANELQAREDASPTEVLALRERALEAYARCLALVPDDPQVLNDAAVVLHHDLHRDLERAGEMYRSAVALAEERLAAGGLSEADAERFRKAREDARRNLLELEGAQAGR